MAPDRAQIALPPRAGLSSPSLPPKHPGRKLFDAALRRRGAAHPRRPAGEPWDAEHFGLHKASAFRALDARRRQAVLAGCARGVLEEAYFIEKLGLAFAAKMALLADSTEERAAHCLFAADEAVHLAQVGAFIQEPADDTQDGFLRWLADVIERMPAQGARLLVQVLLEGWGISHYRSLSRACKEPALAGVLARIARDEVLHHRAGVSLFEPERLQGRQRREAADRVAQLFDMVRAGPIRVAQAVERAHGGLGKDAYARLFVELEARAQVEKRLALLRKLLSSAGASFLIA